MLPRKCRGVVTGYAMRTVGARCVESSVCTGSPSGYHPGLLPSCAPLSRHTLEGTEDDHVDI